MVTFSIADDKIPVLRGLLHLAAQALGNMLAQQGLKASAELDGALSAAREFDAMIAEAATAEKPQEPS